MTIQRRNSDSTLHYLLLAEAANLETQRQIHEGQTTTRYSYNQPPETTSLCARMNEKIARIREEYLPEFFGPREWQRTKTLVGGITVGMVVFSIGCYMGGNLQKPT